MTATAEGAHVIALVGDDRTLCGLKAKDTVPLVLSTYVEEHMAGHGLVVCPLCLARLLGFTEPVEPD